jgi:hypothetical protein
LAAGFSAIFSAFVVSVRGSIDAALAALLSAQNVAMIKIMFFTNESIVT